MAGAEIDVLKAQIVRNDVNTAWGFRLQGGADMDAPLKIHRVTPGSPAARIGLRAGDEVTEIGDTPTRGITHQRAQEVIRQYGLSLILTVERRAQGAIPTNPVMTPQQNQPRIASYQPYDMSGGPQRRAAPPGGGYDYQSVSARPYDAAQRVPAPVAQNSQPSYAPPAPGYTPQYTDYPDHPAGAGGGVGVGGGMGGYPAGEPVPQSRSFKILQGLMSNDEPYAGSAGLPPPRSAHLEQWREEQEAKRRAGPRVKVFMPQQYNSPIGMYSAGNVIDTFQTQAEVRMQDMERPQDKMMSEAQRAVLEEDANRPRY